MKKLKVMAMAVVACVATFTVPLAPLALVGCTGGCAKIESGQDKVVVNAERTAQASLALMDAFVTIEQDNRAFLNTVSPKIEEASHRVQKDGMAAFDGLRAATQAYKSNRSPENAVTVQTWLATLETFRALAVQYTTEASAALSKRASSGSTTTTPPRITKPPGN